MSCDNCVHGCKNFNACINFQKIESISSIKNKLRGKNLKEFCKKNGLKYDVMMSILNGKSSINYKYQYLIFNS